MIAEAKLQQILQIKDLLSKTHAISNIYVYGSVARGNAKDYSMMDLLVVVKDSAQEFMPRQIEVGKILEVAKLDSLINVLVYTEEELLEMLERKEAYILDALDEAILIC